ncbi:YcaO-like family protein [Mammaliicoccus sciuri]|uniref:YcaO-like family protein n=1 Tax=Mammaliicoccus sciuri TaxID=1296 RepID=UPI003F55BAC3
MYMIFNNKKSVFLPSQMVNFKKYNHYYYPISSNGFSCHLTPVKAIYNSIMECIERDITLRNWALCSNSNYSKIDIDYINIESKMKEVLTILEDKGWHITILNINTKLPVYCINVFAERNKVVLFGASADQNIRNAINKAMYEACSNYNQTSYVKTTKKYFYRYQEIIDTDKQYNHKINKKNIFKYLKEEGIQVFLKNFTTEEIKNNYNRYVYRVIIPDLIYYNNQETLYIKKLREQKKINKIFNTGIFSPYI